jgi:hypothetical protein
MPPETIFPRLCSREKSQGWTMFNPIILGVKPCEDHGNSTAFSYTFQFFGITLIVFFRVTYAHTHIYNYIYIHIRWIEIWIKGTYFNCTPFLYPHGLLAHGRDSTVSPSRRKNQAVEHAREFVCRMNESLMSEASITDLPITGLY